MIGHIVLSSVCDQATSLQVALGTMLSHQRNVIDHFHSFKVTSSYNELRRFRISAAAAVAKDDQGISQFDSNNGLVQVVADNFDTQISSQNGQKSTHGLAMIVTQAGQKGKATDGQADLGTIKRLKWQKTNSSKLSLVDVSVKRFQGRKQGNMPEECAKRSVATLASLARTQLATQRAVTEDFAFLKKIAVEDRCPEYGGFNTRNARERGQQVEKKTSVMYTPFLDMTPSEPDTMKTAMVHAQHITALTGQEWTIFTCDQQLYKVVVNILWHEPELFPKFVPRLGGMHCLMSFVGAVGALMAGSGLEDVLKSTFAGVPKLLSGKKFPENIRALRIVVEEVLRPVLDKVDNIDTLMTVLETTSRQSRTTKLWVDCLIKPVLIIMSFVRAEREGDWLLHLSALEKMMPYFFSSGHINYARYGLYYLRSMQQLHRDVQEKFLRGEHVMRHQDGLWNGLWSDLFIETTYMRYGKGPSGIIGSTLNDTTLAIWALSLGLLGKLKQDLEVLKDEEHQKVVTWHKEERPKRITADSADRLKIREALSSCIDVFDSDMHPPGSLVNIFSGQVVEDKDINVDESLIIGSKQRQEYEMSWPSGFHNKISKNVKPMIIVTNQQMKKATHEIVNTELIYARVIGIMASSRDTVSTETLFSHELAPFPSALFGADGEMRTTSKSVLKSKIKVECSLRKHDPSDVVIVDGCAVLWTIPWPAAPAKVSTFVEAAVSSLVRHVDEAKILHIVFDRYYGTSIKSQCRVQRANGISRVYQLAPDSPLPRQSVTLNVIANKVQIIGMIVNALRAVKVPEGKKIITTGPDPRPIDLGSDAQLPPLTHEEADVLMAHHTINEALAGHSSIKVVSDDTDVLVILAHHLHAKTNNMPSTVQLYMESCTKNRTVIHINEVVKKHAKVMPNLLAMHALTGCDSVSSFSGIGKTTALKQLQSFANPIELGNPSTPLDEVVNSCLPYVCHLYRQQSCDSLNTIRTNIFTRQIAGKRHSPPKLSSLPPTMPAFKLHCARAHYQAVLWNSAGMFSPPELDPLEFGWEKRYSLLQPVHLPDGQAVIPNEVLHIISCGCKSGCRSALCNCSKFSLACTEFCKCKAKGNCENVVKSVSPEELSGEEEDEDE